MKKFVKLLVLALSLALAVSAFAACGANADIVGTWKFDSLTITGEDINYTWDASVAEDEEELARLSDELGDLNFLLEFLDEASNMKLVFSAYGTYEFTFGGEVTTGYYEMDGNKMIDVDENGVPSDENELSDMKISGKTLTITSEMEGLNIKVTFKKASTAA